MDKLKRAVIKEEYIAITGDYKKAVILNQFIYWSERVSDFDKFIEQENERARNHGLETQDTTNGWIYKSADELSEETMLSLTPSNIRTHIKSLVNMGFIDERQNPKYKWDRTKQYRVNLVKICKALNEKGYTLEGYKAEIPFSKTENHVSKTENHNDQNEKAIPEITTETTSKTTTKDNSDRAYARPAHSCNEVVDLYNKICKSFPKVEVLSDDRKRSIRTMLKKYSIDDLKKCFEMAEQSDFMKGDNNRGWRADFNWMINEKNFVKIIEGSYNYSNRKPNNQSKQPEKYEMHYPEIFDFQTENGWDEEGYNKAVREYNEWLESSK